MSSLWGDSVPSPSEWEPRRVVPAPELDALGYCTWCQQPEELHVAPDGVVSVREFHRAASGVSVMFLDELD